MNSRAEDCIFCSIVKKEINAKVVSENDQVMAFHDINPAADLHLLIIPKVHLSNVNELSKQNASVTADMMLMAKDLARQFGVDKSGFRLVMNTERAAGQTVYHLHLHLLGGRDFSWPPG